METADRFRTLLPAVDLPAMTVARDCVVEADSQHEIVVRKRLARTVLDRRGYRKLVEEMLASGNCELSVSEREISPEAVHENKSVMSRETKCTACRPVLGEMRLEWFEGRPSS
ncbi:transcriptional regulator FilR1 domain-containing protein [Natronococcus occultus]|uniref:Uncharacterized protein n=1 Tax=Natronococcus occultus SP4 TaxID=694430 RepID=L0JY94_9EURY|nr:hypothetical protein [Natronococcus occultus]AGB37089.1 hypothetical protein Natoc_1261 [Natronococcus occultus SP4]